MNYSHFRRPFWKWKTDVDKEIRQIAKETNGDFFAFDIAFSTSGSEAIGVNYNWIY